MATTYNQNQQVFCLNILSNLANRYTGTADEIAALTATSITSVLGNAQVTALIGNWSCVWGPKVVAADGLALNTMYIAHNADTDQYVVAIAGTDAKSYLDWFLEDFLVVKKVDWPYTSSTFKPHPMTSLGTSYGLNSLIGMAEVQSNGDHVHARDYLKSVAAKNVTVTGHSLGGALSPAYALYLQDTLSQWADGKVVISCLPVAGATPGDQAFSDHYSAELGATTTRVWNATDIVPHGFEQDMLSEIATIFEPKVATPLDIKAGVDAVKLATIGKGYTQLMPAVPGFSSSACNNATTFDQEILCQHICAYAEYFQISGFQVAVQQVLNLPTPYFSDGCS